MKQFSLLGKVISPNADLIADGLLLAETKGAEFIIYDSVGNEVETITTDNDGYGISRQLPLGDYTVVETVASDGYSLDDTEYPVTISSRYEAAHVNGGDAVINVKQTTSEIEEKSDVENESDVEEELVKTEYNHSFTLIIIS